MMQTDTVVSMMNSRLLIIIKTTMERYLHEESIAIVFKSTSTLRD